MLSTRAAPSLRETLPHTGYSTAPTTEPARKTSEVVDGVMPNVLRRTSGTTL